MALYDYECNTCQEQREVMHSMHESPNVICAACGGSMRRVILSAPAIRPDLNDFSQENKGKGRWNGQLGAYVKSKQDTIDKGKSLGYTATDA